MNLLLVFPRFKYASGQPPLGISALHTYLKKKAPDIGITVFDGTFSKNKLKSFEELIKQNSFDAVGFSIMNTMISEARSMAGLVRQYLPGAKIIAGGPQATVRAEYFIESGIADISVIGEGEVTLLDLLTNGADPKGVRGTVYKKDNEIVHEETRDMVVDLDELPIPDRDIFDMDSYFKAWNSLDVLGGRLKGTSVVVSRGCPYQCSFCQPTLQKIFGRKVRKNSPERVIEELSYLKKRYDIDAFMFEDDTFLMDKTWASKVCDLMIKDDLGLVWCCNVRANLCSYDILKCMRDAGLRKINIGIESASQKILDEVFKKNITIEQVEKAVSTAKSLDLYIQGYFMIGHPRECAEDIEKTIDFASNLDIDEASFSITTPLPGTALFESDKDTIEPALEVFDYYSISVYSRKHLQVSPEEIERFITHAYLDFYLKPRRLIKQVISLFSVNGFKKFMYKLQRVVSTGKMANSRYLFVCLYVWLEKHLSLGDYKKKTS